MEISQHPLTEVTRRHWLSDDAVQSNVMESDSRGIIPADESVDCKPLARPQSSFAPDGGDAIRSLLLPPLLFGVLIWIAHFWKFRSFGLYEDDYYRIPTAIGMSGRELLHRTVQTIFRFGDQGRPLHEVLIYGLSNLGFRLHGLAGMYLLGFAIVFLNACLLYSLLRKLTRDTEFAVLCGIAFSLFPSDTTQAYLTHSFGLQPSLTLLLIAFHLYLSGWIKLSYLAIFFTLFLYETPFPVFVVAPLLERKPAKKRRLLRHAAALAGMVVFTVILRRLSGEQRVSAFSLKELAFLVTNPLDGPVTAVGMYAYRPIEALFRLNAEKMALGGIVLVVLSASLLFLKAHTKHPEMPAMKSDQRRIAHIALLMLILAYPFALTTTGLFITGRSTRVHLAASLGASILLACAASWSLRAARNRKRNLCYVGISLLLALLACFEVGVQQDYELAWKFQRSFWTELVTLCPDLKDGTVIFVDPSGLPDNRPFLFARQRPEGYPDSRQIKFLLYPHIILQQVFEFPPVWQLEPMVYRLPVNWKQELHSPGDMPVVDKEVAEEGRQSVERVQAADAIFLQSNAGHLTRLCGGHPVAPVQRDVEARCGVLPTSVKHGPLYPLLIHQSQ